MDTQVYDVMNLGAKFFEGRITAGE